MPDRGTFTLPVVNVMDNIPDTQVEWFNNLRDVSAWNGPTGPLPKPLGPQPASTKTTVDLIEYGGKLERGNEFGHCDVLVAGTYESVRTIEIPAQSVAGALAKLFGGGAKQTIKMTVEFIYTAKLTITPPIPPTFTPAAVSVVKGTPGPPSFVEVQVNPPGPYHIVFSHNDENPRFLLVEPTTTFITGPDGHGIIKVRDNQGVGPRGPITVTATISPEAPCTGQPVIGTFIVNVGG